MRFAYTAHNNAIKTEAVDWVERMISARSEVYTLLDGSMLSNRDLKYLERHGLYLRPALVGSLFEDYGLQGPLIGMLDTGNANILNAVLKRTDGIPCLSFIASPQSKAELCKRLIWLAKVDTEDGQSLHCRFADTRTLPSLLDLLNPEQHNKLAEAVSEWAWVSRDCRFATKSLHVVPKQEQIADNEALRLDNTQYARLIGEAEPDMVFQILTDEMPDALPDEPSHVIHQRLVHLLDAAHCHHILDFPDLFQYAVIGLGTCDDFDLHPEVQETWQQISEGKRFQDLVRQWPDEIWDKLSIAPIKS